MAYEELFTDLLKAEREEDVTDALTVFGLEKFSDSNWLPYGGIENNYGIIGAQQASDEDIVTIMSNGDQSKTSLVNMDNLNYKRYVYGNPRREQEIRNIYKISSTIMGLWLLEQVDKGGLEEPKRRAASNSLGRLLLPMVDSLGSKLAELEQV
jgi:hypothetical protein